MSTQIKIPSWKTRIALFVQGKIIPFDEANASIKTPKERIHTVQKDNAFWVHLPHEYTLEFKTWQVLDLGGFIADLQEGNADTIGVVLAAFTGAQWAFKTLGFSDGVITATTLGPFTASAVPAIEVSCEFLNWTPKKAA